MYRIQRDCNCFLTARKAGLGPMRTCCSLPLTTLNRPDVHQEIVNRYAKYSENYWAGVKIRQLAYLRELREESCNMSVYRLDASESPSEAPSMAVYSQKERTEEQVSVEKKPAVVLPKEAEIVDISCNSCLKK